MQVGGDKLFMPNMIKRVLLMSSKWGASVK